MVFRDSFADFYGGEALYNEETALIRMLLCVQQLHAKRLLEAGIYTRRCTGIPPVGLHEPLPKQSSLACKNTHTISDHLRSQASGCYLKGVYIWHFGRFSLSTCPLAGQQLLRGYSPCSVHHTVSREGNETWKG